MCEQVSAHVTEYVNVRFGRGLKAWPRHLNAATTNTHPQSNDCNKLESFYSTTRGQKVPIKSSSYQKPQASVILFVTATQVQLLRLLISWLSV